MNPKSHRLKEQLRKWFGYLPLSDRQFNTLMYRHYMKRPLHIDPPITFNEKIQWLKLFGSNDFYTSLVDKYAVRKYVATKIGDQYLNELYGIFDHEYEIDFDALPNRFVLKATHGSGWNILCRDKSQLDIQAARMQLKKWLKMNFYRASREPNYKKISPKIICERFLEDEEQKRLLDFKFFCFRGRAKFVQVDFDRFSNHTRNMYSRDWVLCPFTFLFPNHPLGLRKPENFGNMIEVAEELAGNLPFVRVDLYNVTSRILFGELTFTPESGFGAFKPQEWDYRLGTYLQLPDARKAKES